MRISHVAIAVLATVGTARAEISLSIPLDTAMSGSFSTETYRCESGDSFAIQYLNAGENALAVFPVDGQERIFVNVLSGSGARYASGPYIWWTKGDSATLENQMEENSIKNCRSE